MRRGDGMTGLDTGEDTRAEVRSRYGEAARAVLNRGPAGQGSCCGGPVNSSGGEPAGAGVDADADCRGRELYGTEDLSGLPEQALLASLGCGNPLAVAELREGERVLDLGSGGGIDVLLSARRVGPTGFAYGVDMTEDMLSLARANAARASVSNVEFLAGEIEALPLPDACVDAVISNCVINLSADKDQVLREAFRVLKPGGRLAVSDVVTRGDVPDGVRQNMLLWVGCIAGALQDVEYVDKLTRAGFERVEIEPTRVYNIEDARAFLTGQGIDVDAMASQVEGKFMGAFVRATKPATCCGPDCCAA
jgi:arsenite methyltransferase